MEGESKSESGNVKNENKIFTKASKIGFLLPNSIDVHTFPIFNGYFFILALSKENFISGQNLFQKVLFSN